MDSKIIPFPQEDAWEVPSSRELAAMSASQLKDCLAQVQVQIQALDAQEPANMESEAYEDWAEVHENWEDLQDEILDLLDTF